MADRISQEHRSWNMSRIRGKDTGPERQLRSLLHRAGFRFRLHDAGLPGKPDLVLPRYRTVIFVHGCYWHRHPGCSRVTTPKSRTDFWLAKFQGTVERDQRKAEELRSQGWRVVTIWECDLERDPDAVLREVRQQLTGVG
jgi:DNA mismatch endonuclease (patch repair protein)